MPSIRYFFRLIQAFLSRFKALIIIGIGIGVAFFLILSFLLPKYGGWQVRRVGIAGRYTSRNLPTKITEMISDGLTALDENGNVIPNLSSSWSTPDKGKTWSFILKDNLFWQDGRPLSSKDISYQFSDAKVSYPDDKTITFSLQDSYSAFPSVVSKPVFKTGLLGTGEWKVKNLSLVGEYIDQITIEKEGEKEKIIYKFYPTEERLKLAFQLGEVDEAEDLMNADPLSSWSKVKMSENTDRGEYVAVFFNMSDNTLSDKSIRQALSYATNKDQLEQRAISPISEDSWAYNPQVKQYSYDVEKAKSMINALSAEQKENLNITLTTSSLLLSQAEKIQKDWQEIGIKTTVQVEPGIPSNYQALLAIFDIPDDPDQYSMWHSTQTQSNITHYSNPRIDKLLEDGRTVLDITERKQIYLDFQRFLVEDPPAIFLYYPTTYTIKR